MYPLTRRYYDANDHSYVSADYCRRLVRFAPGLASSRPPRSGETIMIAGHYGLAAGVKSYAPRLPLWALMLSTFLLDVVFIFLNIAGIEYLTPVDPARANS